MKYRSSFRVLAFGAFSLLAAMQAVSAMDFSGGGGAGDGEPAVRSEWGATTLLAASWVQNAASVAVPAVSAPDSMADHPFHVWNSLDHRERRALTGTLDNINFFSVAYGKERPIDKIYFWVKYLGFNKKTLGVCAERGHKNRVIQMLSNSFIYGLTCYSPADESILYLATPSLIDGFPWAVLRGKIEHKDGARHLRVSVDQKSSGLMFLHDDGAVWADTTTPVSVDDLPPEVLSFLKRQTAAERMNQLHDPSCQHMSVVGSQNFWKRGVQLMVASGHVPSGDAPRDFRASVRRAVYGHLSPSREVPVLGVGPKEICPVGTPCPFTDRFHLQCLLDALNLPSEHRNDASYRPKEARSSLRERLNRAGVLPHISSQSLDAFLFMVKDGGESAVQTFMIMAPRICERATSGSENNEGTIKQMIYIPIYERRPDGTFTGLPVGFYFACAPYTKKFVEFDRFDVYHAISADEMHRYMAVTQPPLSKEYSAGARLHTLLTMPFEVLAAQVGSGAGSEHK